MRPVPALKARVLVARRLDEALDWARERDLAVEDDPSYKRPLRMSYPISADIPP